MDLKGLYMVFPDGMHTFGIQSINDEDSYNKLKKFFFEENDSRLFLQSDSGIQNPEDKSYLFIEYLGFKPDDFIAMQESEYIAKKIGLELKYL